MIVEGGALDTAMHVLASVLLLSGSFLAMVAGIGIVRFPDLLARMHAATKPQVLGLMLLMGGLALEIRTGSVVWTLLLVVLLQLITAPVSAHMVGRAGYRTSQVRGDLLVVDELTEDLAHIEAMGDREGDDVGSAPSSVRSAPGEAPASTVKEEAVEEEVLATQDPETDGGPREESHEPPSGRG